MTIQPIGPPHERCSFPIYPVITSERPDKYSMGGKLEVIYKEDQERLKANSPGGRVDHYATIISISLAESVDAIPDLLLALNAESRSASKSAERVKEDAGEPPYYILFLMREDKVKDLIVEGPEETIKED